MKPALKPVQRAEQRLEALRQERDERIRKLRRDQKTLAQIAELVGLTRQRVAQILKATAP